LGMMLRSSAYADVSKGPLSFIFMPGWNGFIGCPRNVCIPCLWDLCTSLPGDMSMVDREHWANLHFRNNNLHHTTNLQYIVWKSWHILPDWALNVDGSSDKLVHTIIFHCSVRQRNQYFLHIVKQKFLTLGFNFWVAPDYTAAVSVRREGAHCGGATAAPRSSKLFLLAASSASWQDTAKTTAGR
jgi:hypothetical protein